MQKRKKKTRGNPLVTRKINSRMRRKLVWLLGLVVLALIGLCVRITYINATQGTQYTQQVLSQSQQKYDSRTIPFRRGDIQDRNGVVLATSEKVYKIILDCRVVNSDEDYIEPTIKAMVEVLGLDEEEIRDKLENEETKNSQYQIMKRNVSITDKKAFEEYENPDEETAASLSDEEREERSNINGVWFEEDYLRTYPLGSTACDLIGFTYTGNTADWGIEGYYSSTLNGVNGRQYGYFTEDADVEQTIIDPENGNTVISTIDVNIQQVVEKYIQKFMEGMAFGPNGDEGAENVGVVVADPNNGEILAMASSDPYDLNDPRDLTQFYTQEEIDAMSEEDMLENLNLLWRNFCISETFEPGSTVKPMTVAAALESGSVSSGATYVCDGYQMFGDQQIKCSIYPGYHGEETLADSLRDSCNDVMMQLADAMGAEEFMKYQDVFNFGSLTGIDLPGEARGILHIGSDMNVTELATASFGQGYTCTMIQEVAALCSVINGGYYYQPHVVSKILDEDGNVVKNIEPVMMKQTVSSEVSALVREYMGTVVEKGGTGYAAKLDGYSMGGKTGTAQKISEETGTYGSDYLVSFIGFAPLENPQVVVYVVVDEPNTQYQANSMYAQYIAKQIMGEILPYLNIFQDEAETGETDAEMAYFENQMDQKSVENAAKIAQGYSVEDTGSNDASGDGQLEDGSADNASQDEDGTQEEQTDSGGDTGSSSDGDTGSSGDSSGTGDGSDAGNSSSTGDGSDTGNSGGNTGDSSDTGNSSSGGESGGSEQGVDNSGSIVPPDEEEEVTGGEKQEDGGITNEDAELQSGN